MENKWENVSHACLVLVCEIQGQTMKWICSCVYSKLSAKRKQASKWRAMFPRNTFLTNISRFYFCWWKNNQVFRYIYFHPYLQNVLVRKVVFLLFKKNIIPHFRALIYQAIFVEKISAPLFCRKIWIDDIFLWLCFLLYEK